MRRWEELTWWIWCLTDGEAEAQRGREALRKSHSQATSASWAKTEQHSWGGGEGQLIFYFQMA